MKIENSKTQNENINLKTVNKNLIYNYEEYQSTLNNQIKNLNKLTYNNKYLKEENKIFSELLKENKQNEEEIIKENKKIRNKYNLLNNKLNQINK